MKEDSVARSLFIDFGNGKVVCKFCHEAKKDKEGLLSKGTNMNNKRIHLLLCKNGNGKIPVTEVGRELKKKKLRLTSAAQTRLQEVLGEGQAMKVEKPSRQLTIDSFADSCNRSFEDNANEQIALFIIESGQAFSVIESDAFRELVVALKPSYATKLCSRKTLVSKYIPRVIQKIDEEVMQHLSGQRVVIDIDGFQLVNDVMVKQICCTDEEGNCFSLGFADGHEEDAEAYAQVFLVTIERLEKQQITTVAIGSDNASVMSKARRIVKERTPSIIICPCFYHAIDLLADLQSVEDVCFQAGEDARRVVALLSRRKLKSHLIRERERENKFRSKRDKIGSLKKEGQTRRISRFNLFKSVIENMTVIKKIIMMDQFQSDCRDVSDLQFLTCVACNTDRKGKLKNIQAACSLYCILHETQRAVERQGCDLSYFYSLVFCMLKKISGLSGIEADKKRSIVDDMKEKLSKLMESETILAAALDPRRQYNSGTGGQWDLSGIPVLAKFADGHKDFADLANAALTRFMKRQKYPPATQAAIREGWYKLFHRNLDAHRIDSSKFQNFKSFTPLNFWKYHLSDKQSLRQLAEKVAIPVLTLKASSACVERVNSGHKFVHSLVRNRLTCENSRMCLKGFYNKKSLRNLRKNPYYNLPEDERAEREEDVDDDVFLECREDVEQEINFLLNESCSDITDGSEL